MVVSHGVSGVLDELVWDNAVISETFTEFIQDEDLLSIPPLKSLISSLWNSLQ